MYSHDEEKRLSVAIGNTFQNDGNEHTLEGRQPARSS